MGHICKEYRSAAARVVVQHIEANTRGNEGAKGLNPLVLQREACLVGRPTVGIASSCDSFLSEFEPNSPFCRRGRHGNVIR